MACMRRPAGSVVILGLACLYSLLTACGWGGSPTAPDPPPTPTGPTVTITSSGVSPRTIDIPVGGRLTIVNRDSVAHDMASDPHPGHDECPELNDIGELRPGEQRTSGNLVEAGACGMHDHLRPLVTTLHVRITIRSHNFGRRPDADHAPRVAHLRAGRAGWSQLGDRDLDGGGMNVVAGGRVQAG